MKKILALAVGMLLIPFTAFGMQMMSAADMDSITGQSGVAISLDNIQIFSNSEGSELWYETYTTDGTTNAAAAVGLVYGDSPSYLFLNKIAAPGELGLLSTGDTYGTNVGSSSNRLLRGDYSALASGEPLRVGITNKGPRQTPSVLSIRVAQHADGGVFGNVAAAGVPFDTGAYIEIGLPRIEIFSAQGSFDTLRIYVLGDGAYSTTFDTAGLPLGSGSHRFSLGTVYTTDSGSTTAILGGRIGITSLGQIPQAYTSSGLDNALDENSPW